jgi:hypothetical protein
MTRTPFTIADLKSFLERQPPGPIAEMSTIVKLLTDVWKQFDGGDSMSMQAYKLKRIEEPFWDPPHLTFWIERHGETVLGSTNATVHRWCLDLDDLKASIVTEKRRRVRAVDKRLDVKAIAAKVAEAIIAGRTDERFAMLSDGKLKIEIGRIIPETVAKTTAGRRRKFRKELTALLKGHGWLEVRHNVYSRVDQAT